MSRTNSPKSTKLELRPTPVAAGVAASVDAPIPKTLGMKINHQQKDHWSTVDEIAKATSDLFATAAMGINETVEAVKELGCDHVAEFNATVAKTNEDLKKFADDYVTIRDKHKDRKGAITSIEDRALSITVVEEYRQFQAMFNGVMGHTVISFTEFALEAKDRQKAKEQQITEAPASTTPSESQQ